MGRARVSIEVVDVVEEAIVVVLEDDAAFDDGVMSVAVCAIDRSGRRFRLIRGSN